MAESEAKARFIEPMLLVRTNRLPEGANWQYELKLDGYRTIAFKSGGRVCLRSRNNSDFNDKYPAIAKALSAMPDETVIDGEIVAVDERGHPSFNSLQNYAPGKVPLFYYVFDVLVLSGQDMWSQSLLDRREALRGRVLSSLGEPIRESPTFDASLADLIQSAKAQGLEGLVAKRLDSRYEAGMRSGAWLKMRVSQGQEFVIGGYTVGGSAFDALVFGYYEGGKLVYAARTRNGFTPRLREELMKRFRPLETDECPFANLPEKHAGRWGTGLTAAKMVDCRWLKPSLVGQFEFVEWTPDNHLRHARFIGLREDKNPKDVARETINCSK
jgi:bifunctional non-homologous end joining protein LigD